MRRFAALCIFLPCSLQGSAQNVHLPGPVLSRLQALCVLCQRHAGDSLRVLTSAEDSGAVYFHNSLVAFRKDYLDEAYTYVLGMLSSVRPGSDAILVPYAYFLKAKILYYKHLYGASTKELTAVLPMLGREPVLLSNVLLNLGEIGLEQSAFTEALARFESWRVRYFSVADYSSVKSYYQNTALCLFHLGKYAEAESRFLKNVALEEAHQDTLGLAISDANLANLYYTQYMDAKALPYFRRSYVLAKRAGDLQVLENACLNMAVVVENGKNYGAALDNRKEYEQLHDSSWNRDRVWALSSQERKFAAQLNDNKVLLLQQRERLNVATLRTRNWQRNTLLVAAAAFLLLLSFVLLAYRAKVRTGRVMVAQKEELDELNQLKDRLFSIVAHDLRGPVYLLRMHLKRMQQALAGGLVPEAQEIAGNVERAANGTYHLLDNLLHWALSQSKQLSFRPERLSLSILVGHVCYDFVALAEVKGIGLEQSVPEGVWVWVDGNSVKILLRNLLDNAIKYTGGGGAILVSGVVEGNDVLLVVRDTGMGMDAAVLAAVQGNHVGRVQVDAEGNRSTGFGLGLCQLMAEKNGGMLRVESVRGVGTTVTVQLPLCRI